MEFFFHAVRITTEHNIIKFCVYLFKPVHVIYNQCYNNTIQNNVRNTTGNGLLHNKNTCMYMLFSTCSIAILISFRWHQQNRACLNYVHMLQPLHSRCLDVLVLILDSCLFES